MPPSHPVGYARALVSGGAAGLVASAVGIGVVAAAPMSGPPLVALVGSGVAAGVLGGLVYAWGDRLVRRPSLALWITSLALATLTSAFLALLPVPTAATRFSPALVPVAGLVYYLQQVGALLGIGGFTSDRIPGSYVLLDTVLHYATAIVVSLLVPRWARSGSRVP